MAEKKLMGKTKGEVERKTPKKPLENINSFLYKLWTLVNDESVSSIYWSHDGEKVVIENPTKFTAKVLAANDKQLFKTKNIASFIRQLNLYGFRRVKESCGKIPLIFKNEFFKKGQPDLLVNVKRKKSGSLKQPVLSTALPLPSSKETKSTTMEQNHVATAPVFSSHPSPPTSQPHPYISNSTRGKNVPMPFVTPFAVNHGPTFINLGSHSTIFSKPRAQANRISKVEENSATGQKSGSTELLNVKVASESLYNPWQYTPYYNLTAPLQDPKIPAPSNTMAQKAFMPMHSNYPKYPTPYFNGSMFPIPQLGYRNYGDPIYGDRMSYQNLRNPTLPTNPYLPFSSFPAPPFLKPVGLPTSPKSPELAEHFPKLQEKTEVTSISSPTTSTTPGSLESFSVFTSYMPTMKISAEKIITGLTADDEKECDPDEKTDLLKL